MWRWQRIVVVVAAGLSGASGGSCSAGSKASSTTSELASTAAPEAAPTSTTLAKDSCGVVDADLVTQVLGEPAVPGFQDANTCGFSAGSWTLIVQAYTYEPGQQPATSPTGPGVSIPLSVQVFNERSGYWTARGGFSIDGVSYTITLLNNAQGSDTYPPTDGPAQKSRTSEAGTAMLNAIADQAL